MNQNFPQMEFKIPKIPWKFVKVAIIAVVVIILLYGSIYQVSPDEMGVILRFGKFVRTTDPGLHFKLPLGIEALTKVPVQQQLKQEFGFRTTRPGVRSEFAVTSDAQKEAVMLTGDLNVLKVEWIVQYKIKDPYKFLFKMREAQATFRDMNEAVVRRVIGDNSVDEVLTTGRDRLAHEAKEKLQKLCNIYEIGIEVSQLIFQDINPPEPVKPSFNEVNECLQEKERKINEAWAEYNKRFPRPRASRSRRSAAPKDMPRSESTTPREMPADSRLSIRNMPGRPWSRESGYTSKQSTTYSRKSGERSSSMTSRRTSCPCSI